jgi:glycosyltransferase involved in cell wall biosynthesis
MDATVMTTTNQPTLGIALPIYNERNRITQVFSEVRTWAQRRRHWQFLFIDDGSTDGSGEELDHLIRERGHPNITLLRQRANHGKGLAIKEGFAHLDNDLLCFTDGDLAYSFDHIDKLEAALARFDVVIANRRLIPQHESMSLRRRILGEGFNRLARCILGLSYRDTQAGLKGFRAAAARAILQHQQITGFGFDAELLFIAHQRGYSIGEIAGYVNDHHSYKTGKVRLLKDSLSMLRDLFLIRRNGARGLYTESDERVFQTPSHRTESGMAIRELPPQSGAAERAVRPGITLQNKETALVSEQAPRR